jgi:hypothetical protein
MNNKAIVRRRNTSLVCSEYDYAYVVEVKEPITALTSARGSSQAVIPNKKMVGNDELKPSKKSTAYGLVAYTATINNDKLQSFPIRRFDIVKDMVNNETDLSNSAKKMYVARVQPTNIYYNTSTAVVYDDSEYNVKVPFGGVSANLTSKAEIILPKSSSYDDMTITVQKNCFVEIKLPENTIEVLKLPNFLTYNAGFIKGTFTKSGNYTIIASHPDGEQVINISVPYYERLL